MLQPVTRIAAREFFLQALVDSQRGVDADIAVGVRAQLPSRGVRLAGLLIEFFLTSHKNSKIVRTSDVGLRQACGALGDRTIADHFLRAYFYPLVAEAGLDSGG